MKSKLISLMMTLVIALVMVTPAYAEVEPDTIDYIKINFFEENEKNYDEVVPYAVEKEKEYGDGIFLDAPKGSAGFTFQTESGDNKLNVFFNNKSSSSVTLTLFEKSGFWGSWVEVKSASVSGNSANYFQVTPDYNVKYRVEVSNSNGEKILGTLRIRSFRG